MNNPSTYAHWFDELDSLLSLHRHLWQIRAFYRRELQWQHSHPDLSQALLQLTDSELLTLEQNHLALSQWLQPWLGSNGGRLLELAQLEALPQHPLIVPERLNTGIPGRKWQQILAFTKALPPDECSRPVLEWCAGKGHLGRLLALTGQRPVTSLEWQATLCDAGKQQARQWQADIHFVQADAFHPDSAQWLPAQGQAVALHACGELHTTLMRHWVNSDCQRLTFSPCCYHAIKEEHYSPLSRAGQVSALKLVKQDLQLPLQETVTAGAGVQRKRNTEVLWRLAFDEWQREIRGIDNYLPLPSVTKSRLSQTFTHFVQWAAQAKKLPIPITVDESYWLEKGAQRLKQVRLMELVSHFFRRPLELWLALDRVLFLEEHGATVRLGTFCEKPLTPRNILIDAEWAKSSTNHHPRIKYNKGFKADNKIQLV